MRHVQRNNVAFIQPDVWPPVSPDLNPVDYAVWGGALISLPTLKLHVFGELKQAIINAWQELSQLFINRSINEWRRRLECVVQQNRVHIEHLFK